MIRLRYLLVDYCLILFFLHRPTFWMELMTFWWKNRMGWGWECRISFSLWVFLNFSQLISSQPLRTIFAWVRSCLSPKREHLFGKKLGHMTKTAAESISDRSIGRATRSANVKIKRSISLKFTTKNPVLPKNCMFLKLGKTQLIKKLRTA